ncbi:MAG: sugar kinase [Bacillus sp. (in: Bacteria)]|nr:sugar kinase [Bacillus sp. (in: firmicutes)]
MDVITIGETMVLFTPDTQGHMRYAKSFTKKFGGAESNVAIGLTNLGHQVGWISRVGDDEFGKSLVSFVAGARVDVSQVTEDKEAPTGLYFKELRTQSEIRVQYYRKGSAASRMTKEHLNEEYIKQAKFLHLTGITPALSDSCYEMMHEAIKIGRKHNVSVIFDPNLRTTLWSEKRARKVLKEFIALADVVLPGVDEGEFLYGTRDPEEIGQHCLNAGANLVIVKVGEKGAWYINREESKLVPGIPVKNVADPIGAGDGFAAGFISGQLDGLGIEASIKRGNLVGSVVVQVSGDVEGLPDRSELARYSSSIQDVTR